MGAMTRGVCGGSGFIHCTCELSAEASREVTDAAAR